MDEAGARRKQLTGVRKKRMSDSPRAGHPTKRLKVKVKGSAGEEGAEGVASPTSPAPGSAAASPVKRTPKQPAGFKRKLAGKKKMVRPRIKESNWLFEVN